VSNIPFNEKIIIIIYINANNRDVDSYFLYFEFSRSPWRQFLTLIPLLPFKANKAKSFDGAEEPLKTGLTQKQQQLLQFHQNQRTKTFIFIRVTF